MSEYIDSRMPKSKLRCTPVGFDTNRSCHVVFWLRFAYRMSEYIESRMPKSKLRCIQVGCEYTSVVSCSVGLRFTYRKSDNAGLICVYRMYI